MVTPQASTGTVATVDASTTTVSGPRVGVKHAGEEIGTFLLVLTALGPFDDPGHAGQLATTFVAIQRTCQVQLVLLGTGAHRGDVVRRAEQHGLQNRLRVVGHSGGSSRSNLLAAGDLVIASPKTPPSTLLEAMAAGRAVVAPAGPATARLVMPHSAGLLYWPGDASAMTAAVLRLATKPRLRHEMACRAGQVATHQRLQRAMLHRLHERNDDE